MGVDQVVTLGRAMLLEAAILILPILVIVLAISLIISVIQVLTSLQDQTIAAVPRLLGTGVALFFLMPWMWRHMASYTTRMLSDFRGVLQ